MIMHKELAAGSGKIIFINLIMLLRYSEVSKKCHGEMDICL
jgi:hypothetical protein